MSNREEAVHQLRQFLQADDRTLFFDGTHQNEKHKLALAGVLQLYPAPSTVLFRTNSKSNTGMFLADVGIKKVPQPGAFLAVSAHRLYTDTINPVSWRKSPVPIDVGIVYPLDAMRADEGSDCVADLIRRQAKKILLVTWTDNRDFGWTAQFDPVHITYDAAEEQPEYHERMKELEAETIQSDLPKNLPAYAKRADPARLVRLHCRGCNTSSWAELNVPYPGKAALRRTGAGYTATCLKCGRQNTDNYNWYGRE